MGPRLISKSLRSIRFPSPNTPSRLRGTETEKETVGCGLNVTLSALMKTIKWA